MMYDPHNPHDSIHQADAGSSPAGQTASYDATPAGFCQNCGRPLTTTTVRRAGDAILCEPCLLEGKAARPADASYATPGTGPYAGSTGPVPYAPYPAAVPNPGLAALLGFIPGVGAMYNEQYAKGFMHLLVFVILVALTDANGIFLIFVFGWEFYMALEAHHTAKARRDGLPLPNPFGLNDIGDRLGFGRSWPGRADVGGFTRDAAGAVAQGFRGGAVPPQPATTPWGAPAESYAQPDEVGGFGFPAGGAQAHPWAQGSPLPGSPTQGSATGASATQGAHSAWNSVPTTAPAGMRSGTYPGDPRQPYGVPPTPPWTYSPNPAIPSYGAVGSGPVGSGPVGPGAVGFSSPASGAFASGVPLAALSPTPSQRVPAGALWLIGLGILFLLLTTGHFSGIPGHALIGFGLLGLGGWLFTRRMLDFGTSLANDGSQTYQLRLVRALRGSAWVALVGVWFLLGAFHIVRMSRSWPLFVILAGVMTLLERLALNSATSPAPPLVSPLNGGPLPVAPMDGLRNWAPPPAPGSSAAAASGVVSASNLAADLSADPVVPVAPAHPDPSTDSEQGL